MTEVKWEIVNPSQIPLKCHLDMNGDGQAEYSFESCPETGSQEHVFEAPGMHKVKMIVDSKGAEMSTVL